MKHIKVYEDFVNESKVGIDYAESLVNEYNEAVTNEAVTDLVKYVETASEKTFKGGGNGQNLLDNAMELASHIEDYEIGRPTRGYEEDGFYGPATVTLFKRLVDQMSADDIKNNQADKYESRVSEGATISVPKLSDIDHTRMNTVYEDDKTGWENYSDNDLLKNYEDYERRKYDLGLQAAKDFIYLKKELAKRNLKR